MMEEVCGLKNIVISVGNGLLCDAIAEALRRCGQFRCQSVPPERSRDMTGVCRGCRCDVLLMEVSRLPGATLPERLCAGDAVRALVPGCRVALLCDEVADPELAQQVTQARQQGRIDGFLYASVTEAYLTAALEAL